MPLSEKEKNVLLNIARQSIESKVRGEKPPEIDLASHPPSMTQRRACFVTLKKGGELRGCVGSLDAQLPLVKEVQDRAVAAAFEDFRFPPVREDELDEIKIEISCLTKPKILSYQRPEDLLSKLVPGRDGVVLSSGVRKATFLPQVWEKIPDVEDFLTKLCYKMGVRGNLWREKVMDVRTYRVEKFNEG